jgi:hypothetical protein
MNYARARRYLFKRDTIKTGVVAQVISPGYTKHGRALAPRRAKRKAGANAPAFVRFESGY